MWKTAIRHWPSLQAAGFTLMATGIRGKSLYAQKFPKRVVLIMGAETSGVSKDMHKLVNTTLMIPGTGKVESLNVSVAFALLAGEFARQRLVSPHR